MKNERASIADAEAENVNADRILTPQSTHARIWFIDFIDVTAVTLEPVVVQIPHRNTRSFILNGGSKVHSKKFELLLFYQGDVLDECSQLPAIPSARLRNETAAVKSKLVFA